MFSKVNNVRVPIKIFSKRKGDMERSYADVSLAAKKLNWKPTKGLKDMCKSSWRSFKKNY